MGQCYLIPEEDVDDLVAVILRIRENASQVPCDGTSPGPDPTPPVDPPTPPDGSPLPWECYYDQCDAVTQQRLADIADAREWTLRKTCRWHYDTYGKDEGKIWGCPDDRPPAPPTGEKRFHHYNPRSWDGRGSSVVLCPGEQAEWVSMEGERFRHHGPDKGRQVWTERTYSKEGMTGTLEIKLKGHPRVYVCEITDDREMTDGDCRS